MTKVINFCAGPSAGKTSNGLRLAPLMKFQRRNVLYVPEFAMERVVARDFETLDDQLYVFGEQARRLYAAKDQFDYVVTDSPLFMMIHYLQSGAKKFSGRNEKYWKLTLTDLIMQTFEMYENYTFFVERGDREFLQTGRIQNREESIAIDNEIKKILAEQDIKHTILETDDDREPLDYLIDWGVYSE